MEVQGEIRGGSTWDLQRVRSLGLHAEVDVRAAVLGDELPRPQRHACEEAQAWRPWARRRRGYRKGEEGA